MFLKAEIKYFKTKWLVNLRYLLFETDSFVSLFNGNCILKRKKKKPYKNHKEFSRKPMFVLDFPFNIIVFLPIQIKRKSLFKKKNEPEKNIMEQIVYLVRSTSTKRT